MSKYSHLLKQIFPHPICEIKIATSTLETINGNLMKRESVIVYNLEYMNAKFMINIASDGKLHNFAFA